MVPADSARISRVPAYSGAVSVSSRISPKGLSPAAARLSRRFGYAPAVHSLTVLQPRSVPGHRRFGLLRVRSPLLAQSRLFSFPPGTEMFQFPGLASCLARCRGRPRRVAPFGYPRLIGYLPLTAAFRSLSRPSSPPRAKASFMCPSLLSFNVSLFRTCALRSLFASVLNFESRLVCRRSASLPPCSGASPRVFVTFDLLVFVFRRLRGF